MSNNINNKLLPGELYSGACMILHSSCELTVVLFMYAEHCFVSKTVTNVLQYLLSDGKLIQCYL